jgi:glyoxylase-like metal-dependent hydrolase (beta-lactamase superfamily II)
LRDEAKNAEVFVHNWETGHRHSRLEYEEHLNLLVRAGVPEDEIEKMRGLYDRMRKYADSFGDDEFTALWDDAELEFESGSLRILHTPGHTPGSCSFLREADRTIIAGDCVLKRITPNPVLSPDPLNPSRRFPSLAEYMVSLARLRSFSPTLVYGGHGEPIQDYEELFHRYFRAFQERQSQVIGLVPKNGVTAWDVALKMFPKVDDVHRFLSVSEAVAHLDMAYSEGKISYELNGPTEVYKQLT